MEITYPQSLTTIACAIDLFPHDDQPGLGDGKHPLRFYWFCLEITYPQTLTIIARAIDLVFHDDQPMIIGSNPPIFILVKGFVLKFKFYEYISVIQ